MPIYEYLCPPCNRVYSFLVPSVTDTRQPVCPKCGAAELHKQVSRFAFVRGKGGAAKGAGVGQGGDFGAGDFGDGDFGGGPGGPGGPDPLDDPRMEREMMRLMQEAEHIDENDPRQLGRLMRRMSETTGEPLDAEMEEAVRRLESGEDPDKIEADMGDVLGMGGEGGGFGEGMGPPTYDDGLYSL
jgi:putative FmdB family regulatory protein